MLSLNDFTPITLEDKSVFDKVLHDYPPLHSDYMFTTMVSWRAYGCYHYATLDDNLIIYTKINNVIRFRPPLGQRRRSVYEAVMKLASQQPSDFPIGLIDEPTKIWLSQEFPHLRFIPHRDYFEYVYRASDLASLPGTAYSKIRNRLNKFKRSYKYGVEMITVDTLGEIKDFLKRWCIWKDCASDPLLEYEQKAVMYSIDHFEDLGLSGTFIRIDGTIQAVAVYEAMSPTTAVIHYEKASPDFMGIYKAINAETADLLQRNFEFINRESDMGVPGLRRAKLSYRPHHMVEVSHMDRQSIPV
jgi:hypothetical protein